jgi:alanyl-tRNA synthetase
MGFEGRKARSPVASVNDIRERFLSYFEGKGHTRVPSASLIPANDPTLLFTNAGMVPFKNVFTGREKRPYATAASAQKCVRAGGKHNDLENVGYTARHHTFFEMLGNFSFADYFKEQAILYAWELLTREFGVAKEKLTATVYHTDEEACRLWKKISGLPESRIVKIATDDNFWAMGETGPCGPCSEIFYDHGAKLQGHPPGAKGGEGKRFVEVWNLVFMQFEQVDAKTRKALPKPSIDTGMGLERIAAVLQGTHDNYQIDTFKALIAASVEATGVKAEGEARASHRVIADHLRASSFLIADGVLPTNEGRGYVLRRIMRRAMRHAHILGAKDLLLYKLVPVLVREMGSAYPELGRASALITETLKLEESRFRALLENGLKLLGKETSHLKKGAILPGAVAFKLYDTFGFPLDLTQDALKPKGIAVDAKGFAAAMAEQRKRARAAWKGSGEQATDEVWFDLKEQHGGSDFLGYKTEAAEGKVLAIVKGGRVAAEAKAGDEVAVIANQTPFYGEGGGQVGDTGSAETAGGAKLEITNTQKKLETLIVHYAKVVKGALKAGEVVALKVDGARRARIRANHSVTHLLHKALRARLGPHIMQKGSLVAEGHLRFDITHPKQIARDELVAIEADVNAQIRENTGVTTRLMAPDEAVKAGAVALFGEKYGEEARVVSMGEEGGKTYSVELCGGTHVHRTGDIALFVITGESSIASGVRRIEALTGEAARQHLLGLEAKLRETAALLKIPPSEVPERVAALLAEKRKQGQQVKSGAAAPASLDANAAKTVNGVKVLGQILPGAAPGQLRALADAAKAAIGSGVVALIGVNEGKASLVVGVTADLMGKINAVDLARVGAEALGGTGGGGRPDLAQAGGPKGDRAEGALKAIEESLKKRS